MACRNSSKHCPAHTKGSNGQSVQDESRRVAPIWAELVGPRNIKHRGSTPLVRLIALLACLTLIVQPLVVQAHSDSQKVDDPVEKIPTLVVLPLDVAGTIPRTQVQEFEQVLMDSLRSENYRIVSLGNLNSNSKTSQACKTLDCAAKLAKQHGAPVVLTSKIRTQDRNYEVRLELHESSTKKILGTSVESCELCGLGEIRDVVGVRASVIKAKIDNLALQSANLTVRSVPEELQISMDGDPIGMTPLQQFVKPGEHEITASKEGYFSESKAIHVIRGVREILDFELEKKTANPVVLPQVVRHTEQDRNPAARSQISMEGWGWISLAAGLGSSAAGATFFAIHNRPYQRDCSGKNVDLNGTCRYRYDTRLAGSIFVAVGGALLITSITLLIVKSRAKKRRNERSMQTLIHSSGGLAF